MANYQVQWEEPTRKDLSADDAQVEEPRLHAHIVASSRQWSYSLLHLGGDGRLPANTDGQAQCEGLAQVHRGHQVWLRQKNRDGRLELPSNKGPRCQDCQEPDQPGLRE